MIFDRIQKLIHDPKTLCETFSTLCLKETICKTVSIKTFTGVIKPFKINMFASY